MTIAERFRDAMTLQWESGQVREFDDAVGVIRSFDMTVTPGKHLLDSFCDYDRPAKLWTFKDNSWVIVANDGSAIYEVGPLTEITKDRLRIGLKDVIMAFDCYVDHTVLWESLRNAVNKCRELVR